MPRSKKSNVGQSKRQEYVRGSGQPGFDPKISKWRDSNGRITTMANALEEMGDPTKYGSYVQFMNMRPISRAAERMEALIAGVPVKEAMAGVSPMEWWFKNSSEAQPIPTDILARMKLSEYYYETEGDIAALVDLPIDFGLQPIEVSCPDKGVQTALREFYGAEEGIDLDKIIYDLMICERVYGQAYPLEVWLRKGQPNLAGETDTNKMAAAVEEIQDLPFDKESLPAVVPLNPKNMFSGQMVTYGKGDYAMTPDDVDEWSVDLLIKRIPKLMYVSLARKFNEQIPMGHVPLNPDFCQPVYSKKQSWQRYAYPQLSKCLRAISTRQILEELIRGTIEGYKNQLWLFLLGSETQPPSPQEIKALRSTLDGSSGERTSYLVWRMPLKVEQHAPKSLDEVSGNELWKQLTIHVFRQMGITPRLIGDVSDRGASRDFELDIDLYIARVNRLISNVLQWERHFRMNWVKWENSPAAEKWAKKARVSCGEIDITRKMRIRDELMPYIQAGLLSDQTSLEKAGYDYDVELARKRAEEPNRELFGPKATYAQTTVKPETDEKEAQTAPQGRPAAGTQNADSRKAKKAQVSEEGDDEGNIEGAAWNSIGL